MNAPALDIITTFLVPNEVCMGMRQGPRDGRWVEMIWVVRGDTIAKYMTDCGPVENFPHIFEQIIPGDGETTVTEFQHEAERHRHDLWAWEHQQRVRAESTLFADVNRQREERREYIDNRSVFGPYQKTQRNIYNQENAWRKFFDERARRTGRRTTHPSGGLR